MEEDIIPDSARILLVIFVVGLLIGAVILGWMFILGPLFNQADYTNYNNSSQHLQAVAQKASDDCLQLAQTTDQTSRKAIENDIYQVTSTVNLSEVQMPDSTRACVTHAIADVTGGK